MNTDESENHTVNKSNAQCDIVDLQMVHNGLI